MFTTLTSMHNNNACAQYVLCANLLKLVGAINSNLEVLCSLKSRLVNYVNDSLQLCQVEFL